jgi:hypothetical protein
MNLQQVIEAALDFDVIDFGDSYGVVDTIFNGIDRILQQRLPHLSLLERDLLLADIRRNAEQALAPYVNLDSRQAAEAIANAVIEHANGEGSET